ncbi:MAG: TolC family protein [Phycisphaeraceae bacterium]
MTYSRATLLSVILLAGCAAEPGPFDAWIERDPDTWQLGEQGAIHAQHTLLTTPSADANELPDRAGAEAYVRLALARNPLIRAAQSKVQRLAARIPQETSLDDPMFEITPVGDMAETAAGMVGLMTGVSQKVPFPGKLATRGKIAQQDVAMAEQELAQMRLDVVADTRQAYWSYYFATQALEVMRQNRALFAQFRDAADARYRANLASQQDVLRASVELSELENELITLEQQRSTAAAMLNSLMDRAVTAALPAPKPVELEKVSLALDDLLRQAAEASPELGKLTQRLEGERQRMKLARLARLPDFSVGVAYAAVDDEGLSPIANGQDQWWVTFGFSLPIWADKLAAGEREAYHGLGEAIAELTGARNRVAFRVQDALVKVQTQERLVVLFRDVILPQARQTVEASTSGYQAGSIDFLTLVDNWRNLLNYQLLYHQSLSELEKSFAALQQAVGRDVARGMPTSVGMEPSESKNEERGTKNAVSPSTTPGNGAGE